MLVCAIGWGPKVGLAAVPSVQNKPTLFAIAMALVPAALALALTLAALLHPADSCSRIHYTPIKTL